MNSYYVVSTVPSYNNLLTTVNSNNINDALKNFIKFHHNYNINEMIMKDQYSHYKANIKYLKKKNKKKAVISYKPFEYNAYSPSVIPIMNNHNEPSAFINTRPINTHYINNNLSPVSSIMLPTIPSIFDYVFPYTSYS
jgi:hypothetical protein